MFFPASDERSGVPESAESGITVEIMSLDALKLILLVLEGTGAEGGLAADSTLVVCACDIGVFDRDESRDVSCRRGIMIDDDEGILYFVE